MQIYQHLMFEIEDGTTIHELRPTRPTGDPFTKDASKFYAIANHVLQTSHGPMQDQFKIDIEAVSLEEAFARLPGMFPIAAQARVAELNAAARQQAEIASRQIIVPGVGPVVTGKPKTRLA